MPTAIDIATASKLVAVPAGAYTEITDIVVPSSAVVGSTVNIEVKVRNTASYSISIYVNGRVNGLDLDFGNYYYTVEPGAIQSFYDAFIMPNRDVTLTAWSWYKIDGWTEEPDDKVSVNIALAVVWVKLATKTITITPEVEVAEWVKLATRTITITPIEAPPGWVKLASQIITLTPTGVPPPPPPPPEEKKFPWAPVLIGGGALIAIGGLAVAGK